MKKKQQTWSVEELVEEIYTTSAEKLSLEDALKACKTHIDKLKLVFNNQFDNQQCFLLAFMAFKSLERPVFDVLNDLATHLKTKPIRLLNVIKILNDLFLHGTIQRTNEFGSRGRSKPALEFRYFLTSKQLIGLLNGEPETYKQGLKVKTNDAFIDILKDYCNYLREEEIEVGEFFTFLSNLLVVNKDLALVQLMVDLVNKNNNLNYEINDLEAGFDNDMYFFSELIVLSTLISQTKVDNTLVQIKSFYEELFQQDCEILPAVELICRYNHYLFKNKMLEEAVSSVAMDDIPYFFTKKFYRYFKLDDRNDISKNGDDLTNIIFPRTIKRQTLLFDAALENQLNGLSELLSANKYKQAQKLLKTKYKRPGGICVLFYGKPGTGKTEFVYQLAKQTQRKLMTVDFSELKSMWFGKSEKLVKEQFDEYNNFLKQEKKTPILFINEADGLFGTRVKVDRTVDQTSNTIQNIILEELERFKGILICTTNLMENLDKAFERRFMFKVKFDNPKEEVQQKLWQHHLSFLTDEEAAALAKSFQLSPAQIANVAGKVGLNEIMGIAPDYNQIKQLADSEMVFKQTSVGFNILSN